jgi:hypothetical protein
MVNQMTVPYRRVIGRAVVEVGLESFGGLDEVQLCVRDLDYFLASLTTHANTEITPPPPAAAPTNHHHCFNR